MNLVNTCLQSPLRKNPIINYNPERMLERAPFHSTIVTASCLTTARSRQLSDSFATEQELVNKYPLFVSWYCAVRLELILKTVVVPLYGAGAYIAVFEWSPTGGMVHLHIILWKRGALRFDLQANSLLETAKALRKTVWL